MLGIKVIADGVHIHDQLSSLGLITLPKKLDGVKFISIFVPRTIYHVETFHSLRLDIIKTEETINQLLKKNLFRPLAAKNPSINYSSGERKWC